MSTNNISCTDGLNKCSLETLPALLGQCSLRVAGNMASCKLLGRILHLQSQLDFINDPFFCVCVCVRACRQMIEATTMIGPDFSCDFKVKKFSFP